MIKITTDDPNFNRDPNSKALLNVNQQALEDYRLKKSLQNRINSLEENVSQLNSKLDNVLNLLTKLMDN
jgi:CII-binding regulator of phage lambda lysogenization HflD